MERVEKKKLILFIAIAFGFDLLMCIPMYIGYKMGKDLSAFVLAMMTYPACAVILGHMLYGNKEKKIPKVGFIVFLLTSLALVVVCLLSVVLPETTTTVGGQSFSNWNLYSQYVLYVGSLVTYIIFWVAGKEKRRNVGFSRNKLMLSIAFAVLFIVLYFGRIYLSVILTQLINGTSGNQVAALSAGIFNATFIGNAIYILCLFPISFIAYLGEEYGWRYYLQPVLQKKFGLRGGVIVLGILWGLWHVGADFLYYTKETGPQMLVSQLITCFSLAAFFGYVYMKTKNIWLLAFLHFINNNFIALITGDVNSIQNQSISWKDLPLAFVIDIVFWIFILAPIYNKKNKDVVLNDSADEVAAAAVNEDAENVVNVNVQ